MPVSPPHSRGQSAASKASVRPLKGTIVVTRRVHFNAAHRLHNPDFSEAWNQETYGLCNNPNWHGHNYELEVSVIGEPDPRTGYVCDLSSLKALLNEVIVARCDHRNLNLEVPFLEGVIPTTENLVIAFWNEIAPKLKSGRLQRVRLYESERNFAEYYGPDFKGSNPPG
jgi:6-pyruvoyltetrahydropterin/6-carboxytetrahydropterin synthase